MSAKYHISVFHFWPKFTHPAAWSLCDICATCLTYLRNAQTSGLVKKENAPSDGGISLLTD